MPVWTPAERRGALLVALLLALGGGRDLWRATHAHLTPEPGPDASALPSSPAPEASGGIPSTGPPRSADGGAVDLNRAGLAELDALPGIGPVLASRILAHRRARGPFGEPEDLLAVPGIGPRLFERLRPLVRAGPAGDSVAGDSLAGRRAGVSAARRGGPQRQPLETTPVP